MDRIFKIGLDSNDKLSEKDILTINEFLRDEDNYNFEITEFKVLRNNEILIIVSDTKLYIDF